MDIEELNETKLKQLANMPIIETKVSKSRDGKYIIHKTIITDIKPLTYYEKIMEK